jgi:hypothetical protein
MITFKQFLREDEDEHHSAPVRLLTPNELQFTKESVALAKLIHEIVKKRKTLTVEDVKEMADKLHVFNHLGFIEKITTNLDKILKSHGKMLNSASHLKANLHHIKSHGAELKKAFLKKDFVKAKHHSGELKNIIDPVDHNIDASNETKHLINREFYNEPSFFGTTKLLDRLMSEDYQEIEKIDTDKPLYTAIDFPFKKLEDDWHYIVYFLKQLKTDDSPISFKSTYDFRKFVKVAHASDENFKKLHDVVDNYLHSNNRDLIPQIVELIELVPTIKKANDKRKAQIKTVYRGLGFGEDEYPTETSILRQEKKRRFVATSESKHAAKNFALQKGHLEGEEDRRSGVGYIIQYSVTPDAILFDTKIIETVFNESEILIDATKAKFIDMEQV